MHLVADQHKSIRAAKRNKGKKGSKIKAKPNFEKTPDKSNKTKDENFVPVTEIPRARTEILPTSPPTKNKDPNPVWFSDVETKKIASNSREKSGHYINNQTPTNPITPGHFMPTPSAQTSSLVSMTGTEASATVQMNGIPTRVPPLQRARVWGLTESQKSFPRSRVQNSLQSNTAMLRKSQNVGAQYGDLFPNRNPQNLQLAPGYARPPNLNQWPGVQAWPGSRGRYQNWARIYSPHSYSSDQIAIGRRKRDVDDDETRRRRQSTVWYNTRQFPSRYNNLPNLGIVRSSNYQQPRKYFMQNAYRSSPNQFAGNSLPAGYQRPASYAGQTFGTGALLAGRQFPNGVAPGFRSHIQKANYGTQPGILTGAHPAPVERWPTLANKIRKPSLALHSQNTPKTVLPSTKSKIETAETIQKPNQNTNIRQPTNRVTSKEIHKQTAASVERTNEPKKDGSQNNLSKKLHHMSAPVANVKTHDQNQKQQKLKVPVIKRNEKHVVPMFGGDILLSVGVLQLLQKFLRLSASTVTESELKVSIILVICLINH